MSGSPPLPPKPTHEAGDRSRGSHQTAGQDVYRGASTVPGEPRLQLPAAGGLSRPGPGPARAFAQEHPERLPYSFPRPEEAPSRSLPYPPQAGQLMPQHPYPPLPGVGPGPPAYPASPRPPALTAGTESPQYATPKTQRKTKGHVASACVPCKKAHLR